MATGARIDRELHVTEVDGVAAVWADLPCPYTAGMLFRVGHADETLARHGITHMLEHLALHGVDRPGDHSNGQVDATTLAVQVAAEPSEVAQLFARVVRQLRWPPLGRLELEKGVIRTERAGRAPHPLTELSLWRWGVRTYGLEVAEEYGLTGLTQQVVQEWAKTYVSRQNAVLWFTGPPPAGLRVDLPEGRRHRPPVPHATPLPSLPAYFVSRSPLAAVNGLVRRGPAAAAVSGVLRARLVDELRVSLGAAYAPQAGYRPIDGETGIVVAFSDIVEGHESTVANRMLTAIGELCWPETAVRVEELEAHRALVRREVASAIATPGIVTNAAWNLLHGGPVQTAAEVLDNLARLTPDDVTTAAQGLWATQLAQLPSSAPVTAPDGWVLAPLSPASPVVGGRRHRHLAGGQRFRVASAGVTFSDGTSELTVRQDHVALLGRWQDGGRLLIGNDGVHLSIEPTVWRRGSRLVAAVDALVPADRHVTLGARPTGSIPLVPLRHRAPKLRRALLLLMGAALAVTAGISALAMGSNLGPGAEGAPILVLILVGVLAAVVRNKSRGK